jgi:hypothetical protein
MAEHLLGHLARRFTPSEENLATEALTWILRDPSANEALCAIARAAGADVPAGLTFVGQLGNPETGRPDVIGLDSGQVERLIIEAKFAAGLTAQQPLGYLGRLPKADAGILLVVAPSARLATLWSELLRAVPQLAGSAPSPSSPISKEVFAVPVGAATLALTSWRHLVSRLLEAVKNSGNPSLAQDVEQLLALTEVMDSQAYAPVNAGDYGPEQARGIQQLEGLIDGVHEAVDNSPTVEHEGRASHGRIFYGWYLRSRSTKKAVWFGFLPRLWAQQGISPLWMQVKVSQSWSRHRLAQALNPLHALGGVGVFETGESFYVPLTLRPYLSKDETVTDLLEQIQQLVALLDSVIPSGETPSPDIARDPDEEPEPA